MAGHTHLKSYDHPSRERVRERDKGQWSTESSVTPAKRIHVGGTGIPAYFTLIVYGTLIHQRESSIK